MAASFSTCISLLLLTTLSLSLQIHARDSQFFSKVTHFTAATTNNNNNNVVKETELPNKELEAVNKPEQQPAFIPETESSYGLYGHESSEFPPTTTTTKYKPYKTESEEDTSKYPNTNTKYYHYNKDAYNTNQNEFTNTRLTGTGYSNNNNNNYYNKDAYGGYSSLENQKDNQQYYYNNHNNNNNNAANDRFYDNNNNNVVNDKNYYNNNNAANNRHNGERQGLSDTRFVEGGKYFYDLNTGKHPHHSTLYGGDSSRGVNSRNWENNRGYFGNNNGKSYENNNSFDRYQNQEEFEEEQEEFEP